MRSSATSLGKAVIYGAIGWSAVKTATGDASKGGTDSTTAKLMQLSGGQLIVGAIFGGGVALFWSPALGPLALPIMCLFGVLGGMVGRTRPATARAARLGGRRNRVRVRRAQDSQLIRRFRLL